MSTTRLADLIAKHADNPQVKAGAARLEELEAKAAELQRYTNAAYNMAHEYLVQFENDLENLDSGV